MESERRVPGGREGYAMYAEKVLEVVLKVLEVVPKGAGGCTEGAGRAGRSPTPTTPTLPTTLGDYGQTCLRLCHILDRFDGKLDIHASVDNISSYGF